LELPTHLELTPAWRAISAELRLIVGESTYDIWLAPLRAHSWDGRALTVQAPAPTRDWVAKRFGRVLERCARTVIGDGATITFAGEADIGRNGDTGVAAAAAPPTPHPLNQRYSFDQFIIGDGNRLAHAAALAVAELPGHTYNPLFLHAPPGLGKTHLLHAIGNFVHAFGDGTTVRYTTVESFTNHFIAALGTRTIDSFKRAYRDTDVLLIDDVQFLASKTKTEEEFFHTFTALYESGRQLVLTCDRLPRQLLDIEERLRERFGAGLVATIAPPDLATRVAILRKRALLDRVVIDDPAVLELVASRITDNIRALEGALIRIVAHASLTAQPVDLPLATALLDEIAPLADRPATTVEIVQRTAAAYFGISLTELLSKSRTDRIAWPRQVAIFLARDLTDSSLNHLGQAFGGRNHATVLHSCKRVSERVMTNAEAAHDVDNIRQQLTARRVDHSS
jgi:chromosomal replication initiator protein